MKSAAEIEGALALYVDTLREAARPGCYWALLHVVAAVPDVCGALEHPQEHSGTRYINWCDTNFLPGSLTAFDRYQLRNALLHQGSTLPVDKSGKKPSQYTSFSFVEPGQNGAELHLHLAPDPNRKGTNVTLNIKDLADETTAAIRRWAAAVEADAARNAVVERNLPTVAGVRKKVAEIIVPAPPGTLPQGMRTSIIFTHPTTSST